MISPVISGGLGAGKMGKTDLAQGPGLSASEWQTALRREALAGGLVWSAAKTRMWASVLSRQRALTCGPRSAEAEASMRAKRAERR